MWSSGPRRLILGRAFGAAVYQWCEFKFRGGRTKICQLKNLILTLLGKSCKCTCIYMYIVSALLGTSPSKGTSAGCKM